jgi:hypothetical protein
MPMVKTGSFFWRSETPVGSPLKRAMSLSRKWVYLWIVPIRSHPAAMRFRHRGRVLLFSSGAALQSDRGQLKYEIRL